MARTKIDWANETINPITGCRNFGNKDICGDYCYAARIARRLKGRFGYPADDPFQPTFHAERLQEINRKRNKTPSRIFLNSMADWLSEDVDPDWIRQIIEAVSRNEKDLFFVLTKRPERILEMLHCVTLPENLWWGVSITKQQDLWRIAALRDALPGVHKFVSFEPLHGPISPDYEGIEWAIIGGGEPQPRGQSHPAACLDCRSCQPHPQTNPGFHEGEPQAAHPRRLGSGAAVSGGLAMKWEGSLMTSFQMMGSLHFSIQLEGYPDAGETNAFLERVKGKNILLMVEEVQP